MSFKKKLFNEYIEHCFEVFQSSKSVTKDGYFVRGKSTQIIDVKRIDWELPSLLNDNNAQYQMHAWRFLDPFIHDYTNDLIKGEEFWKFVLQVIKCWYDDNIVKNSREGYCWFDMSVGIRCSKVAFLMNCSDYDINKGYLTSRDAVLLDRISRAHIERFIIDKKLQGKNNSNHDYFFLVGKKHLYLSYSSFLSKSVGGVDLSIEGLFKKWFRTGCHTENSPAYHFFMLKKLRKYLENQPSNPLIELENKASLIKDMLLFPSRLVQFGDTEGGAIGDTINFVYDIGKNYRDVVKKHDNYSVLDPCEYGDGYFIARSQCLEEVESFSMLAVNGKNINKVHKHDDFLSYELMEKGVIIFTDSGKYSYSRDDFSMSFIRASAHNSVMLEDEDFDSFYFVKGHPLISRYSYDASQGFLIKGEYEKEEYFHFREISWVPGVSFTVNDVVSLKEGSLSAAKLYSFIQVSPDVKLTRKKSGNNYELFVEGSKFEKYNRIGKLDIYSEHEFSHNVIFGGDGDLMTGFYSPGYGKSVPRDTIVISFPLSKNVKTVKYSYSLEL